MSIGNSTPRRGASDETERFPARARVAILGIAFASIIVVGYVDGRTSAYIAFSIFYVVPIFVAAWFGNRLTGALAAITSALCGMAADVWTIGARPVYAYVNLGTRLALFLVVSWAFARLRGVLREERRLAERQRLLAEQERELRKLQHALMRNVVDESRQPLSEIYAKVVDLGFAEQVLSPADARALLHDLAEASVKLSRLIETLESVASPVGTSRHS